MKNLLLFTLVILGVSCTRNAYNHHNSMNSLDWSGRYEGTLPGKKGGSEPVVLVLKEDLSYEMTRNGRKSEGGFAWGPDGGSIILPEESLYLFVGENFLKAVTRKGKEVEGGKYRLNKTEDRSIKEKYWKLIELNGKPVTVSEGGREPHLIIRREDNRVTGNGGCNGFGGTYELNEATGRIRFSKVAATLMACPWDNVEGEFFEVLDKVDNFTTDGKFLSLNKARMAPLARFEVVYLK
ncbi:MAG: META domain-containing protein [Leadbetterella sp.]|nr:META domain-containing protein [Leadbetterella sp.]